MTKLKPCPICANPTPTMLNRGSYWYVHCTLCAESGAKCKDRKDAETKWNERRR